MPYNKIYATIAQNVTRLRENKEWTRADLARKVNMARSSIRGIENLNNNVSIATADKLAKALGVTLVYLITEHPEK